MIRRTELAQMNVKLTPEQVKLVEEELNSGRFNSAEEVIAEALRALRQKEQSVASVAANGEQREAVREMISFVEKNRIRLDGISVKELIHQDHRL